MPLLLALAGSCTAEFLPADDWLMCWRPAIEFRTHQLVHGLDASEHRAELRGHLWRNWHARARASELRAASLEERSVRLALRWRAPWLEIQGEAGVSRGELPGLPMQSGHSMGLAAAMTLSDWRWGVRWTQRRRDVPETARFQFALRHRAGHSVLSLLRENHPFSREQRWAFGAAIWLASSLRMGAAAGGGSMELRWRVQRSALALSGALPLWSELEQGASLSLEWRLP